MANSEEQRRNQAETQDLGLLDRWIEEVYALNELMLEKEAGRYKGPIPRPTSTATAREILNRDDASTVAMVRAYIVKLEEHARSRVSHEFMHLLASRLFKRELPFTKDDLTWLAERSAAAGDFWEWPLDGIISAIERHAEQNGMPDDLRAAAEKMQRNVEQVAWHKATRDVIPRLNKLTRGTDLVFNVDSAEPWARRLYEDVQAMQDKQRARWNQLLAHAQTSIASKPSSSWLSEAKRLVRLVGPGEFSKYVVAWFSLFHQGRTDKPGVSDDDDVKQAWPYILSAPNELLLKGLLWCCQAVCDPKTRSTLETLMRECNRETRFGKRFAEGGTACKHALEAMEQLRLAAKHHPG